MTEVNFNKMLAEGCIIDNKRKIEDKEVKLKEVLESIAKGSDSFKCAVGYFYIQGLIEIIDSFQNLKEIKILMGSETNTPTKSALIKAFIEQIDSFDKNDQNTNAMRLFYRLVQESKTLKVKVYFGENGKHERLHSKAYLFLREKEDIFDKYRAGIIGSSNLTLGGLIGNTELNVIIDRKIDLKYLDDWFENLWLKGSDDFEKLRVSDALLDAIKKSKFKDDLEEDFIYLSPVEFFKTIIKIFNKGYLLEKDNILLPFQELDYKLAKDIIQKFGGVIIANSVGLGKSYIASKLLVEYYNKNKKILLIIPPNLREQWVGYLKLFDIKLAPKDIISMYELSQQDFPDEKYKDYDIILIDEAHNFRNNNSKRYKNLIKKIKNKKAEYILLTATPINNSLNDLKSQIDILKDENKFRNEDLVKYYDSLKAYVKREDDSLKEDIKKIRRKLIVRTTRTDLKKLYQEIVIPQKGEVLFKEPILKTHNYSLTGEIYAEIYGGVISFLNELELPHLKILNPDAGKLLVGLYKILLYKRLESSIYAFYQSLKNLESKEKRFKLLLQKYPISKIRQIEDKELLNKLIKTAEDDQYLLNYMDLGETEPREEQSKEEYIDDIEKDLKIIKVFINLVEKLKKDEIIFKDDKIELLKNIVEKNKDRKILLFTQFVDTANYLYENLKYLNQNTFLMDKVTGDTKDKIGKVIKFSPSSNRDYIDREPQGPFTKFLISTDALSEGVNLQEADWIINYDLPWNPVRLIQRIGRVHRIGNNKDVFVHNFIPNEDVDKEINLVKTLKSKIENIIEIIGSEHSILTLEELEQIRKKEKDDVDLLRDKRNLIRKNKLDELETIEESSKLSEFDKYLLEIIKDNKIKKEDIKEAIDYTKPVFTTLKGKEKGKFFIYTIDDSVSKSMKYKFKEDQGEIKEDYIPAIENLVSQKKYLGFKDIEDVKFFEEKVLNPEEKERKKSQHIVFDERTETVKKKIVRELQQSRINQNNQHIYRKKAAILERKNIPETYYAELHEFYLKWIKEKVFVDKHDEFIKEFDDLLDVLEKVSQESIETKDIKSQLTGFIVYE